MVSKRNFQNGRPMLQQRPGLRDAVLPYKKGPPFKAQGGPQGGGGCNNFQQMMFNGSQIPDNPGYMDFNNPTPPINGVGIQNGRPVFAQQQQNKKKPNKGKPKNKQQQSPSQQNQRPHQNQTQQQKQQNQHQQQQNNGNWNNNNRNIHQMGGYMPQQNRFNGNMLRGGMGGGGGSFNPLHSGGPPNRGRRFVGPPCMGPVPHGIGPMQPMPPPPHGFQPPMIPPMPPMGGRGPMPPPPMGGRGPMAPMGMQPPPPSFLRRNGRGGPMPMHPIPPPLPPMIGPQRMQRINLPPPLFNGIGKIKKPNAKLVQQKIVKNRGSVKTLKTLINQYPIDKPWITDEIRAEHDKKLDLENRLKGHKDDKLFAQFKTQRDTFVALYEKAREDYLKQEAAAVKAKDANDKETLSKTAAAKNGNNKEIAIPQANALNAQI